MVPLADIGNILQTKSNVIASLQAEVASLKADLCTHKRHAKYFRGRCADLVELNKQTAIAYHRQSLTRGASDRVFSLRGGMEAAIKRNLGYQLGAEMLLGWLIA